jgi:hypothetical protein
MVSFVGVCFKEKKMIRNSVFRRSAVLFFFAVGTHGWAATTYDPTAGFEQGFLSMSNPNGVWSYGSSTSLTGPVSLYTQTSQNGFIVANEQYWGSGPATNGSTSLVGFNNGPAVQGNAGVDIPANEIFLIPYGQNSNVVFTAPAAGTYSVAGSFQYDQANENAGVVAGVVANGSLLLSSGISTLGQTVPFSYTVTLAAGSTVVFSVGGAPSAATIGLSVAITGPQVAQIPYYFSHLAVGGGFQTTFTLINYSPQEVTCVTNFYSDIGSPLSLQFSQGSVSTRTDTLQAGQSVHDQTTGSPPTGIGGWAQSTCTGPVQASLLYRLYQAGVPVGEASVNAETAPTTEFATFAQTATGVAYANPSTTQAANITLTVYDTTGARLGSQIVTLGPMAHTSRQPRALAWNHKLHGIRQDHVNASHHQLVIECRSVPSVLFLASWRSACLHDARESLDGHRNHLHPARFKAANLGQSLLLVR